MSLVNSIRIIGNLGKDPEVRNLQNGAKVAKFSVATTERFTNAAGEKITNTDWHTVVVWRKLAEIAEAHLRKGMKVVIEGKMNYPTWQDKDGNTRYGAEIVGDRFEIINWNDAGGNASAPDPEPAEKENVAADDDLPF